MDQLFKILENYGLPTVIATGLLIWAYYKDKRQEIRYDALGHEIKEVRSEQRKELLDISIKAVAAHSESTAVQRETVSVNKELVAELKKITMRPCVARDN